MANLISVRLNKGDSSSWGFRLQGGKDFGTPLIIQKINNGSPAEHAGLRSGDAVIRINNIDVFNLRHKDAQDVILRAGPSFEIAVQRGGLTWKPAVSPVGSVTSPRPTQHVNNLSPVTATSLAAVPQENIGAIGTGHNISAKPFHAVNGGPTLVNKQYNSPLPLYSDKSIAETLSAQSEVLSNGVVGVNFKKNEKSYDSTNSEVFRMVQEADKEPRDYYEPEVDTSPSGVISAPIGIAGLRHVQAPENKPTPPPQQLPPGQNICAECERLIVGVFVRIKDKNLHVECFKCSTCGSSLKNVGYYNLNNKLYCDVHAKLAVKNNPPSPNLVPVTLQPGSKLPSGTISSALSAHSLPTAAPLSPNSTYTPVYQPTGRPYSGVSAPLSPSNNIPKYSTSPVTPQTEVRCVQNTVWPPPSKEPEFPTASPLYFPPPSQVQIPQKLPKTEEQEIEQPGDMSYKTPLGLREVLNVTGTTRSVMESYETVSDSIETQMLVDSVIKTSQIPEVTQSKPGDVAVSFTILESELKKGFCSEICQKECKEKTCTMAKTIQGQSSVSSLGKKQEMSAEKQVELENKVCLKQEHPQSIASIYEKAIKVENTIPHKWESSMVVALTTAPETPYSAIPAEPDISLPLPPKRTTSALAAALAVAPAEPFTPVGNTILEPVPLPEYTEPYFPPEHPFIIERKEPTEEEPIDEQTPKKPAPKKVAVSKIKKTDTDEYLKDLPKPKAQISMLSALTTAPTRPYSPLSHEGGPISIESFEDETEVIQQEVIKVEQKPEPPPPKKKVFPNPEPCAAVFTAPERLYSPFTAHKASYEEELLETHKSIKNMSLEQKSSERHETKNIQTTENVTNVTTTGCPPLIHCIRSTFETQTDKVHMEMSCAFPNEPVTTKRYVEKKTDVTEEKSISNKQSVHQESLKQENICKLESIKSESKIDKPIVALRTQQAEQIAQEVTESTLIQQACSRIKTTDELQQGVKERVTFVGPGEITLNVPQLTFQPVKENLAPNRLSPRPHTPSMINKPPSVLPYYQANLVATQQPPAEGSVYDPKSPVPSRSPSPYPGLSSSPFPSTNVRAVSPAPGPPPNPLKSTTPISVIIQDGRVEQPRNYVQGYIPQHKTANVSYYKQTGGVQSESAMCTREAQCSKSSAQTGENTVQVQRKKVVTEEYEHSQNCIQHTHMSHVSTSEKSSDPSIVGVHVTNPQPLKSPFIEGLKQSPSAEPPKPAAAPKLTKAATTPKTTPNINVQPNVSQPNAGTGGGRQSGAVIPTAPKRGRGVLNLAATPGSRVPLCGHCHANIRGPFITALGKIWCPEHFSCATQSCRRPLQDLGFVEEQGKLYCEFCFEKYLAPLCAKCSSKVKGDCLKAIGKTFHPECFNCSYCGKLFGSSPFFLEDGQPYCENDWNELFTTKCFACGFPVEAGDRWVEALNNNYHSQCFNCTMCKKNLEGQSFFAKGGRPFCKNHAR